MKAFLIIAITFLFIFPQNLFARKGGLFGKQDKIEKIMDVAIKGSKGEELYLAYKTTSLFIFGGVYIKDDGYVLGIKKGYGSYYPLDEKQILTFQEKGFLPNPLPKYKIPFIEYLFGFSIWIILFFVIGFQVLKYQVIQKIKKKNAIK